MEFDPNDIDGSFSEMYEENMSHRRIITYGLPGGGVAVGALTLWGKFMKHTAWTDPHFLGGELLAGGIIAISFLVKRMYNKTQSDITIYFQKRFEQDN